MSTGGEWLKCPFCGSYVSIRRLGRVGVPPSMYGKRRRVAESDRFKCDSCTATWRDAGGVTWKEYYGYEPYQDVSG